MDMKRERFLEIMDIAELGNDQLKDSYGYRGSYGRTCPAVYTEGDADEEFRVFLVAAGIREAQMDEGEYDENGADFSAMELAKKVRTDSMGRDGMVFYFPGLELTG